MERSRAEQTDCPDHTVLNSRAEVNVEHTFAISIVSATSGEPMMSAANVGPEVKMGTLKRMLPNYAVDSSTKVAATRMRFFRDSSEEIKDNESVVPQNHQALQITLKAIIDPRLCACGNQPDPELVCICDYCHFGACDYCDMHCKYCGHCDKFCCLHCFQKLEWPQRSGSCEWMCSQWLCHECMTNNTPCQIGTTTFHDCRFKTELALI